MFLEVHVAKLKRRGTISGLMRVEKVIKNRSGNITISLHIPQELVIFKSIWEDNIFVRAICSKRTITLAMEENVTRIMDAYTLELGKRGIRSVHPYEKWGRGLRGIRASQQDMVSWGSHWFLLLII